MKISGICDDIDDCVGQYDDCGACNGSDLVFDNYCQNDIDFINVLLEVNGLSSSYSWSNFGIQSWENGRLIYLNLSNKNLTVLPDSEPIDLNDDGLWDIFETYDDYDLLALEQLHVSNNFITTIPMAMGNLNTLEVLQISNNNLLEIDDSFWNLINLRTLDLADNMLTIIPDEISNLINITEHTCIR